MCDGDGRRAADLLAQARRSSIDPFLRAHADRLPSHVTLVERGIGPEKVTLGERKSILGFLPQPDLSGLSSVVYRTPAGTAPVAGLAGNLDWLALTRGGRPIDGILDGKAAFKETAGTIASVGTQVAQQLYQSLGQLGPDKLAVAKSIAQLGVASSAVGTLSGFVSSNINAEADTRYWGSLPKHWHIEAFHDGVAVEVAGLRTSHQQALRPVLLKTPAHGRCSFALLREIQALDATAGGTGNPSPWPAEPQESGRAAVNEAFRRFLRASL